MDSSLLEEFKSVNAKWIQFGDLAPNLNTQFNEVADRFAKALEIELPFEYSDGVDYHRVEKLGGLANKGFYFSSTKQSNGCDRFAYWEDIVAIAPVREG